MADPPFNLLKNLEHVDDAIDANADIAGMIAKASLDTFVNMEDLPSTSGTAKNTDLDKAKSTIRQLLVQSLAFLYVFG